MLYAENVQCIQVKVQFEDSGLTTEFGIEIFSRIGHWSANMKAGIIPFALILFYQYFSSVERRQLSF